MTLPHCLKRNFLKGIVTLMVTLLISANLTGCFKSDEKKCIDKQSYLWDSSTTPKDDNKAYWDAVAACKEKYR